MRKIITLTDGRLQHIAHLTYVNSHGEAYILGAETLEMHDLALQFKDIERRRQQPGYLSYELDEERKCVYQKMMNHAITCLGVTNINGFTCHSKQGNTPIPAIAPGFLFL